MHKCTQHIYFVVHKEFSESGKLVHIFVWILSFIILITIAVVVIPNPSLSGTCCEAFKQGHLKWCAGPTVLFFLQRQGWGNMVYYQKISHTAPEKWLNDHWIKLMTAQSRSLKDLKRFCMWDWSRIPSFILQALQEKTQCCYFRKVAHCTKCSGASNLHMNIFCLFFYF